MPSRNIAPTSNNLIQENDYLLSFECDNVAMVRVASRRKKLSEIRFSLFYALESEIRIDDMALSTKAAA